MKPEPATYELCSVDVWDTLLRRRCHPDAVKLHVAKLLLERAHEAVPEALRDTHKLLKARLAAEAEVAHRTKGAGHDDEYTLAEVLAAWLVRVAPALDAGNRDALVASLAQEEWRQEEFICYADPGIEAALDKVSARRWLFLSDFYMSAERLFALLQARGLSHRFADGISSADVRRNKRSGRLYQHVQLSCHVTPAQHLHVGDNMLSDVRVPKKLGMPVLPYRNKDQDVLIRTRARWLRDRPRLYRELERRCRALGAGSHNERFRLGLSLAPLLAGFAQFIDERARRDQVQRLLFCTREGEIFGKAYEALLKAAPHRAAGSPRAERFEASRESTFGAALAHAPEEAMASLARAFPERTIDALRAEHPLERAAARRNALLAYLRSIGLPESGRIGFVDIGWRGSIQDHLAIARPAADWRGYYLGLQEFLNPQRANVRKSAFGPNLNSGKAGAQLFRDLPMLELVFGAPGGSVSGYEVIESGVKVLRQPDPAEDEPFRGAIRDLQLGMLAGVEVWADAIHTQALTAAELRAHALVAWGNLLSSPPRWLSDLRARHKHDERFGRGRFEAAGPRKSWIAKLVSRAQAARGATTKA